MLTIYYEEKSIQVLKDFHQSFLNLNRFEKSKIIKDLVNNIAKGSKYTYRWQDII